MNDSCNPQNPSSYPRRALVATLGLAPQVLTETLYCLAITRQPAFVPTQIHIITTREGAHRARLTLIEPTQAKLAELARDHNIPGLASSLDESNLHVIAGSSGEFLDDIDSARDNAATADLITSLVRDLAQDNKCALHVSIAGGRKTMGFLLGYALSLFGRPQDRLSHVLVSRPFQDHPDFFFPPKKAAVLRDRENRPVSTADANVILADIPVVHLREQMPVALLSGDASYSETVHQAQQLFIPPRMEVDHENSCLVCHGTAVRLPPATFALAAWIARGQLQSKKSHSGIGWATSNWAGYVREYEATAGIGGEAASRVRARFLKTDDTGKFLEDRKDYFYEHLSRLRKRLKQELGQLSPTYRPETKRKPTGSIIRFPLPKEAIRFK